MTLTKDVNESGLDAPLHNPNSDCLDRALFAKRIFKIIEGTPSMTNMTVGILGAWGTGKTTAMNFLNYYCYQAGHPTAIFNPWQFRNRDEAGTYRVRSFVMVSAPVPHKVAYCRGNEVRDGKQSRQERERGMFRNKKTVGDNPGGF